MIRSFLFYCALLTGLLTTHQASCHESKDPPLSPSDSVFRVTATIQYPEAQRPWLKKLPFTREGLGTLLEGGRLLVTADMVAHATMIELQKPDDGPKGSAVVEAIDEECNLAILKPTEKTLLQGTRPLSLDTSIRSGSQCEILQLEHNGAPAWTPATVTTIAVMPYPADNTAYLTYRVATSIPQREGSFVIPALHQGKLAGLVMRYDPKIQSADIIPAPLIARFLKESSKPKYTGLARAGLTWEEARGSTLREWLGVTGHSGVYVTWVEPEGPADKAGLKKGDILLSAAGKLIDHTGNYLDPLYGKTTFNNLASLDSSPGDSMKITYFRSSGEGIGETNSTTLWLEGRRPASEISSSRLHGDSLPYLFLGGLLFEELSRPYLREWGNNWRQEAPLNLVYLDAFQNELPRTQGHLVILSSLFPSAQTLGLEGLAKRVVLSINGRTIHSLADVTEAAKYPENGFQKIILEGSMGPIFLAAATLSSEEDGIRSQYGIPLISPSPK